MATDERSRHRLYQRLEAILGPDEASVLMAHLPPTGWGDVATRSDLEKLRADLEHFRAATRSDLENLRTWVGQELVRVEAQVDGALHRLESRMLRGVLIANSASVVTVAGLAFAAARLV